MKYFIGVDGGGTKTAFEAFAEDGSVLTSVSGPLNYNFIGLDAALRGFADGLDGLGLQAGEIAAIAVGDPSIDEQSITSGAREFAARIGEICRTGSVTVKSDAYMALYALTRGEPGIIVLAGTGAIGLGIRRAGNSADSGNVDNADTGCNVSAENSGNADNGSDSGNADINSDSRNGDNSSDSRNANNGRNGDTGSNIEVAGGWGRLTGDEGSGYYIALSALRAALRCADGIGAETALLGAVLDYFGESSARALIARLYRDPFDPPDITPLSAEVSRLAASSDETSRAILGDAGEKLAELALTLSRRCGISDIIGVGGSILLRDAIVREAFEASVRREIPGAIFKAPDISPQHAAALLARARYAGAEHKSQQ